MVGVGSGATPSSCLFCPNDFSISIRNLPTVVGEAWLRQEMPEFFLGGIHKCLERKHCIKSENWDLILEFAGWKQGLVDVESLPGIPPPPKEEETDDEEE